MFCGLGMFAELDNIGVVTGFSEEDFSAKLLTIRFVERLCAFVEHHLRVLVAAGAGGRPGCDAVIAIIAVDAKREVSTEHLTACFCDIGVALVLGATGA